MEKEDITLTYVFDNYFDFEYSLTYNQVVYYLVPVLSKELGKSKKEVEKLLEDDEFFEKCLEDYHQDLADYYEDEARWEYEDNQEEPYGDGYDSYDAWCWSRNGNLRR